MHPMGNRTYLSLLAPVWGMRINHSRVDEGSIHYKAWKMGNHLVNSICTFTATSSQCSLVAGGGGAPRTIFDLEGGAYVLVHCLAPVWMQVDVLIHIRPNLCDPV